ncbi:MAG: type II toxin-antitoxin system RelE/ParE family toxin, partial [Actinomycetota bacterium]
RTPSGRRPVKEFISRLTDTDAAAVVAAMKDVQRNGLKAAKHIRGPIYEVLADGERATFRILFALVGRRQNVMLALEAFSKKSQKTPLPELQLAERRLSDWLRRGRPRRRDR